MSLINLEQVPELKLTNGIRARVANTGNVSVAHVRLDAGAVLAEHAHPHEQIVNVVDGELELTVEGKPFLLTRGQVMVLPPMVPHSGAAKTDVYVVDVFHPVRDDFVAMAGGKPASDLYDND